LVREKDLLSAEAIIVYPVRLDRGKQVEHVIRVGSSLKGIGRSVRVIIVGFHSTGGDKVTYREYLTGLAQELGLTEKEITFLSQFDDSLRVRSPREVIRDLMLLSNVFVMPSRSETYSLIAQEAGLCGAFLVLNQDFPPFRNIYGDDAAFYQFSSNINALTGLDGETNTQYDNIDDYFRGIALRIAYELEHNVVLAQQSRIRRERNPDYIFSRFLEPLFHAKV
jgi:glycosyltransferase involved in cell wall biosynthesis